MIQPAFAEMAISDLDATASSYYGQYSPDRAVNIAPEANISAAASRWYCTQTGDKWLKLDLKRYYMIDRWRVEHLGAGGWDSNCNTRNFALKSSINGTDWTTVQAVTNNADNISDNYVTPFCARYVMLYITQGNQINNQWASVMDFHVYEAIPAEPAPALLIDTNNPAGGTVGTKYNYAYTATGGTGIKTYAVTAGVLPAGLTLAADGTLSGTPTVNGDSTFTITVTDSATPQVTDYHEYTMKINLPTVPSAPTAVTAIAGIKQATVSFNAPYDGGRTITGYTVIASPGNIKAAGNSSPITISGLATGTTYTFTVTAANSIGTGPASAASANVTLKPFLYTINNNEATITGPQNYSGHLYIPGTIDGAIVTSIGDNAFSGCSTLTGITLPESIKIIGNNAFSDSSLTAIILPKNIESIGNAAFKNNKYLQSITIPGGKIGNYAFEKCSALTSAELLEGVSNIGNYAFGCCTSLNKVTMPDSVITIGTGAFSYTGLNEIVLPNKLTSIPDFAFYQTHIHSITIPGSVTSDGIWSFEMWDLKTIYGYKGSFAEEFAKQHWITFIPLSLLGGVYEPPSSGSSSSGNSNYIHTQLDEKAGLVYKEFNIDTLNTALKNAVPDGSGKKTIDIVMSAAEGAKSYETTLPASILSLSDSDQQIRIKTNIAEVILPGNMLAYEAAKGIEKVSLTVSQADVSNIKNEKIRTQIGNRPVVQLNLELNGEPYTWKNDNAPVTVTIDYTPTPEELIDPEYITVWYIDSNGNAVTVPNGRYDPSTGTVTFTTTHFSQYAVVYVHKTFGDLESVVWAKKPIEVLASKGILHGTSEKEYTPKSNITRADFLCLLIRTLGINVEIDGNFDDISNNAYYYHEIGIAKKLGITTGTGNNKFSPDASISRQDMMVLAEKALRMMNKLKQQGMTDFNKFTDKSLVAAYAVNSVASVVKEGLISGSGNRINPLGNTTRAEAAIFMYKIYNIN